MTGSGLDAARFDRLVQEQGPAVLRICRSVLHDEHLAADAAQEAFLKLWSCREEHAPRNPEGYLRRAAVSVAIDAARQRRAQAVREAALAAPGTGASVADPADAIALDELRARIRAEAALLPELQRAVFALRHEAGMPLGEIAEVLGLALPTVKTHFARAVLKLQGRLRAFRTEEPTTP
jgi:RNA polymerase sigma-70 factor (ECF subfamily)